MGNVADAATDDHVILYARIGTWWLQPLERESTTALDRKVHWINGTHLGTDYAALLVNSEYVPKNQLTELPSVGGPIKAVDIVHGLPKSPSPNLQFSGYQWRLRTTASDRGGTLNRYAPENAWTDAQGSLHLKIAGQPGNWTCAEVTMTESLGFGTYILDIRDSSNLEPGVILAFFTFDYALGDPNHREVNIEVGRWGDPSIKNAQYVVQPFHVSTNVFRFDLPRGPMVESLEWAPGRITFKTSRRSGAQVAQHVFSSGIPRPGLESPRIAFYVYNEGLQKLRHPAEAVIDKFTFLP